jgi:hypothetical protein
MTSKYFQLTALSVTLGAAEGKLSSGKRRTVFAALTACQRWSQSRVSREASV